MTSMMALHRQPNDFRHIGHGLLVLTIPYRVITLKKSVFLRGQTSWWNHRDLSDQSAGSRRDFPGPDPSHEPRYLVERGVYACQSIPEAPLLLGDRKRSTNERFSLQIWPDRLSSSGVVEKRFLLRGPDEMLDSFTAPWSPSFRDFFTELLGETFLDYYFTVPSMIEAFCHVS